MNLNHKIEEYQPDDSHTYLHFLKFIKPTNATTQFYPDKKLSTKKKNLGQLWIILLSSLQVSVIILIEKDKKKKAMLQPSASQSDSLVTSVESS